ncbi:MAG: 30S ribosomal protein S6 [Planctomycetes bacterium]|nr:30S ribosomal protein S6 [Planctomycetota bacterium]
MAATVYECLFLLDSNRFARDPHGLPQQINGLIEGIDGEILVSRLWAEQKLAYTVKGHKKGVYWLTYFRADSQRINELNRACQLNESVLRHLALKVDPRLVDALVAHATGQATEEETEEAAEGEPVAAG